MVADIQSQKLQNQEREDKMLNADVQTKQDAKDGQGSGTDLQPRCLSRKKIETPEEKDTQQNIKEVPSLYGRFITPEDIQYRRVYNQLMVTVEPSVAISSQVNNRVNVNLDNTAIKGGIRLKG
jgi:hypothetical protein